MNDRELVEAIAEKLEYEPNFFVPVDSDELHDAECRAIPPFVELLGRLNAENLLCYLTTIDNWKRNSNAP